MTDIQWLISSSAPNMLKCPKNGHFFISLGQTLGQKQKTRHFRPRFFY
uniref:Uncharacterized protein n=1 Tax=Siphoviridae sp. ctFn287 TaxID=2826215 RepID=A0A8S5LV68_9CAUD|nr:MAG TPA: hypothetical protein [Siphoviridae sp. ctFn287]